MIVGGLLIVAGLWFSSSKAEAYTAWCEKKIQQLDNRISTATITETETETETETAIVEV